MHASTCMAQSITAATPYVVTSSDDTVHCSVIKLKQTSVTCQTSTEKKEWRNEFVRRIYLPVEKSEWELYFKAYAASSRSKVYMQLPEITAAVLKENKYPRFFDMRPLDEERDFWTRGLFEILAQNNGYKLCRLKAVKSATPSFADSGDENLDKYILFNGYESVGTTLTKNNYQQQLGFLANGCPAALTALQNQEINYLKEMPAFLVFLADCK